MNQPNAQSDTDTGDPISRLKEFKNQTEDHFEEALHMGETSRAYNLSFELVIIQQCIEVAEGKA